MLFEILYGCIYSLIATSIKVATISFSRLRDIVLDILWAIPVFSIAGLLYRIYRKTRSHEDTNLEPSQNQTLIVNNETNHNLSEVKALIVEQTTKLEYTINQLQTELSKRLEIKELLLCLNKAVEETNDAICITDTNGFPIYTNKAFLKLFGYSIDELNAVGGLISLFAHPAVGQEIHNLILNGYSWNSEVQIRTRNNEFLQVKLHADAVENQTEQVIGIIAICTNITEQKQAEASLQKREEHLVLALSIAGIAAWEWNLKTKEFTWYFNLEAVLDINPETVNGNLKTLLKYIHPDDRQKLLNVLEYTIEEYVDYTIEFRLLYPDRRIRWIESKGQILYDETGQVVKILATALDITKKK